MKDLKQMLSRQPLLFHQNTSLFPGAMAACVLVLLLSMIVGWLGQWPEAWTLPATAWIGAFTTWFLEIIKPAARLFSSLFSLPMTFANEVLTKAPWIATASVFIALAYKIGQARLALMTTASLAFVLFSGYWTESMATLALVLVSVPLALFMGLVIGVLAFENTTARRVIEVVLDFMQTVPTFAYLTPLLVLFGFGPVVGLIASAIYAAPPMARNVLLGLERIEPEVREAAVMAGTTRFQCLRDVELPAAGHQILIGVNQSIMAALSMVIIAAVIGGFDDIGWEVLLTMRKAQFGQALLAGAVIVVFAINIDRLSAGLTRPENYGDSAFAWHIAILGISAGAVLWFSNLATDPSSLGFLSILADAIDQKLTEFTAAYGSFLDGIKTASLYYLLLPLRIGLDDAVLPFTWGFGWQWWMSLLYLATGAALVLLAIRYQANALAFLIFALVLITQFGLTQLPWPIVFIIIGAIAFKAGGRNLCAFAVLSLFAIMLMGLWERAMLSLYLCATAVAICAAAGGLLGLWSAVWPPVWRVIEPICDTLQTIPLFVFLIPMLMFFQIGEFAALLAICAYAIVPMIRYTRQGISTTPPELLEAAAASGATSLQTLMEVRVPYAIPSILLGLNQTILYAFAMLVIAALIGTTGLGQSIYIALGKADVGLGLSAGLSMALLALIADRLVQAFAQQQRAALGL